MSPACPVNDVNYVKTIQIPFRYHLRTDKRKKRKKKYFGHTSDLCIFVAIFNCLQFMFFSAKL